ncbi:MAG: cell division protein ZapD [Gammaproteobacteria bacterium]
MSAIAYEQPLNERTRAFLRLEHLFACVDHSLRQPSPWDSRNCVTGLIDISDLLPRIDIKAELIKELDRDQSKLASLETRAGVDMERLGETLQQIHTVLGALRANGYDPGQALRTHELVFAVKQRLNMAGGTCSFDLPAFHYWLNQPSGVREEQLSHWVQDLSVVRQGLDLVLRLIRSSSEPASQLARQGFFRQDLDPNASYQMIRVFLPGDARCFPEISGSRHRFTIRFMQPSPEGRASKSERDVKFDLQCCVI